MNEAAGRKVARRPYAYGQIRGQRQLPALPQENVRERRKTGRALEEIVSGLPDDIARTLRMMPDKMSRSLEEIRFRAGRPVMVYAGGKEYEMYRSGEKNLSQEEVEKIFHSLVRHSAYSYQEDLRNGFVTLDGGHRVGICGRAVTDGHGNIAGIRDISSVNIRRGQEIIGVSDGIFPHLIDARGRVLHTLIVSPPKCGKTTVLRDVIRNLSNGGYKVGVCDERCEIAGASGGICGFDLGPRTDVMDSCPKDTGILMLIRSMSPDVIAVDEIGTKADVAAIERACVSGVAVAATMHGESFEDVLHSHVGPFVKKGIIRRLIFLTDTPAPGTVADIKNSSGLSLIHPREMKWETERHD
ncbi:MAG: stage III sporulation protein AA [Anaerovoracaceae bacterium]